MKNIRILLRKAYLQFWVQETKPLEGVKIMEKIPVNNNKLEKVAGGNEVSFFEGKSVCPTCGTHPIRLVSSEELIDTYQCDRCGLRSYHHKKAKIEPEVDPNVCPRCGSTSFVISNDLGIYTKQCTVCHHYWKAR